MNPQWLKWIVHSMNLHFYDRLDPLYIEGRKRPTKETLPRFELRIDGPDFTQRTGKVWYIDSEVNILIVSERSETNAYSHTELVTQAVTSMADCIHILKHGDDESLLGCFDRTNPNEKIEIRNFTSTEASSRVLASTVECNYRMCLITEG